MRLQLIRLRRIRLRRLPAIAASLALALSLGCVGEAPTAEPPAVDRARFEADVYPILLRDCGFPACHGNTARFFHVLGPGRTRLDPMTGLYAAPSLAEIDASFDRARSMLSGAPEPSQSLLVRKPLEASEGGAPHMGTDALGRNVYRDTSDPSWRAIATWAGARLDGIDAGALDASAAIDAAIDAGAVTDASESSDAARDAP